MQRAMAAEAESERDKRAKLLNAQGEFDAAQRLADAAKVMESAPGTMQLRFLDTLKNIAADKNETLIFPLPTKFIDKFCK